MMVPHVKFRSLRHEDIPALRDLQLALFPVRYTDSFYSRLFSYGECLLHYLRVCPLARFSRPFSSHQLTLHLGSAAVSHRLSRCSLSRRFETTQPPL